MSSARQTFGSGCGPNSHSPRFERRVTVTKLEHNAKRDGGSWAGLRDIWEGGGEGPQEGA